MIGGQAALQLRHGAGKPVQASRTGLTVQELKAMTAMRMGQGVDIVMNGYAMGAQNQPQAPGVAAAAHMAANNRFRPTAMTGPVGPMAAAPLPQQVQQPQQQQVQQAPVARVVQPTALPGGRVPEKPPVHSLTVQELKELTRMRLARESLGPNAEPVSQVVPAISASPVLTPSSSVEASLGEHTELLGTGAPLGPGMPSFRAHAVRHHSGNSLMTLTTMESRESSDYSTQTLPSRSSTTSPVSDSALLDSEVNAAPADPSSLAGLGLAAGGGVSGAASQRRQQQAVAANTQQINGAMLEAQRRDLRASLRGDVADSSVPDASAQGQASGVVPAGRGGSPRGPAQPHSPMSSEAQAQAMARLRMEQRALLQAQQQAESQQQQQQQHMMMGQQQQQQQMMEEHRRRQQQMDAAGNGFMNNRPDAMGFASLSLGDLPDQGTGMGMGKRAARTPSPGFVHPLQMHATHDQVGMVPHPHALGPGAGPPSDMFGGPHGVPHGVPHGGQMMSMMGGPRAQPPPPPQRHSPLQMLASETDSSMGHANGFYPINAQPQTMEPIGPNGNSGIAPMPPPPHPRGGSPSMRHKSAMGMPCATPLRERAISDMREGEGDGLAFECAEAVLDFGSSPPSTPKSSAHKTLEASPTENEMDPLPPVASARQEDWPHE